MTHPPWRKDCTERVAAATTQTVDVRAARWAALLRWLHTPPDQRPRRPYRSELIGNGLP